jgi:hypothetical protein
MPDVTLKDAIKEAWASAPAGVVNYVTLELHHSAFDAPIRVVHDRVNLTARLEAGAPRNASELVEFVAFSFDFTPPDVSTDGVPQIKLGLDNVDRSIVTNIRKALGYTETITMLVREYLSTDLTGPQNDPVLPMVLQTVSADVFKVTSTAGFTNLQNAKFPRTEYDTSVFPGLVS